MKKVHVFNLLIDDLTQDDLTSIILAHTGFNFIVTPNLQHVIAINNATELAKCYKKASITTCDSRIVQALSHKLKKPIKNITTGSGLTQHFFENVLKQNDMIMVVGSSSEDIKLLAKKYSLNNINFYSPPMDFINSPEEVNKTLEKVLENKPRFLFLAVGFPRQEILACKLQNAIDFDCTAFCIGASIDFLTGKQKRASTKWQKYRFEWLFRFLQEPKRLFRRYFVDSWGIIPILIKEFRKK